MPAMVRAMAALSRFVRPRVPPRGSAELAELRALTSSLIKGVTVASDAEPFFANASGWDDGQ